MSVFHLNIHSLQYHIVDLKILLSTLDYDFDILAISETKLRKGSESTKCIDIPNYHCEHTPTEANKGGTLIYISNKLNYKPRTDLQIYEKTFIEIINAKGKNTIVGCVYKHHNISQEEFMDSFNPLLTKVNKENKAMLYCRRL